MMIALSKQYDPKQTPKKQGYGFVTGGGARKRTLKDARREAGLWSKKSPNRKANWSTIGRNTAGGALGGAAIGGAAGSVVGHPGLGASMGANVGGVAGVYAGSINVQNRTNKKAWANAAARGDLRKPGKGERVNAVGSIKPIKKSDPFQIEKADKKDNPIKATKGRYAAGVFSGGTGIHGAVAGKKGHKLRAAGNEMASSYVGGAIGSKAAMLASRKQIPHVASNPMLGIKVGAKVGAASIAGAGLGAVGATHRNQRKGHLKAQDRS